MHKRLIVVAHDDLNQALRPANADIMRPPHRRRLPQLC